MTTAILAFETPLSVQKQNKKVLLVIDVQENLLNAHSKLHMDTNSVTPFIESLNKSIKFFEVNDMPVMYTVNEFTNPVMNILTGNVCKKGNKGTGIDSNVILASDKVYSKSKKSAFSNKELSNYLKENNITELYITGLFAEFCVKGTTSEAIKNNYKVMVIEDAVGSKNSKNKLRALRFCQRKGANIISTKQLPDYATINNFI